MGKLNVAIADDNEVMRDLLEEMVTSDDELHLIGSLKLIFKTPRLDF